MTTITRPRPRRIAPQQTALGTLCLFRGPTPWLDPSRQLTTPLWYGKRLIDTDGNEAGAAFQDAGMVQRAVESEIGLCEHRPNVQHMREGVNWITLRDETPEERYLRRVPEWFGKVMPFASNSRDPFGAEPLANVTVGTELIRQEARSLWVSPSLHDEVGDYLTLDDLPEAWTAGNGVTCNTWLPIRKGHSSRAGWQREVFVSFCVLAPDVAERLGNDWRAWETLRKLFESGETGTTYAEPAMDRAAECEHEWVPITPDWPLIRGCVKCRGALKVGNTVTLQSNSILMTVAAAPANPSAGSGVIYAAVDKQPSYLASDGTSTNMYGGAASAVSRATGVTTEATTTSVSAVDLQTGTVSIASVAPFDVRGNFRKTTGAAVAVGLGLKLNVTVTTEAVSGTTSIGTVDGTNNIAADGYFSVIMAAPQTNYLRCGTNVYSSVDATQAVKQQVGLPFYTANAPNATVTSVIIRGISGSASVTLGQKDLEVYSYTG